MSEIKEKEQVFSLENLNVKSLPELVGWEQKQKDLLEQNPFVEITDNATFEVAKKSRTALLKGRTELEKQDKLIASKLTSARKEVKEITDKLILITSVAEEKQQKEVKRFEDIKENERLERERIENERISAIKTKIESFETDSYKIIQQTTKSYVDQSKIRLEALESEDFDYAEYDVMFESAKARIKIAFDSKCNEIQEKENQRIENEKLKAEKEAADKKAKELQDKIDADNLEREQKEKEQKDQIFEIRKNRLAEIGIVRLQETSFFEDENAYIIACHEEGIRDCSAVEFEEYITSCKFQIAVGIEAKEKAEADRIEAEKQKALTVQQEKEAAEKLEKENAERIIRLESDKTALTEFVETLEFRGAIPELKNDETNKMLDALMVGLVQLKKEFFEEIKNL